MNKYDYLMFIILLLLVSCSKSSSPTEPKLTTDLKLDSTVDGTNLIYHPDQKFSLELDLNADAGYQWDYTIINTTVVRVDSTSCRPKNGNWNQVGGSTIETLYFRTMNAGICAIHLIEHQGWMPNVPPVHSVHFNVIVYH